VVTERYRPGAIGEKKLFFSSGGTDFRQGGVDFFGSVAAGQTAHDCSGIMAVPERQYFGKYWIDLQQTVRPDVVDIRLPSVGEYMTERGAGSTAQYVSILSGG